MLNKRVSEYEYEFQKLDLVSRENHDLKERTRELEEYRRRLAEYENRIHIITA
jgi:BMFP domain-containing protein YqiC